MTLLIKGRTIAEHEVRKGVSRKLLLNRHETGDSRLEINKYIVDSEAEIELNLEKDSLSWFHALTEGIKIDSVTLDKQSLLVLKGDNKTVIQNSGSSIAEILLCTVPKVSRFLGEGETIPFKTHSVDWSVEPVLLSEFDSRKRIYLASPGLWQGLSCVKGEMIIYPKGGTAPLHHHENAEHFQYIMEGTGTVTFDNSEHIVEKGDILYFFENEVHAFENKDADEFVFAEFFVPGSYKTIWAKDANVCTWLPTGKDLRGRKAARHIEKHVAGEGTDI
jgi:mannose-6-phosphate isomerase-like protein (cupin superfamily)